MKKTALITIFVLGMWVASLAEARAATKLTLTPASGSYTNGSTISVTMGIDSGTDKVYTADLWMVFDANRLEFVDVVAVGSPAFPFQLGQKNYDNAAGTVNVALLPTSATTNLAETARGDLITLTFKAKNTGTASLGFSCVSGNISDTNVISPDLADVVDCSANQSGSYTITAGVGGQSTTVTPAATTTRSVTTPTTVPSSLPQTGVLTPTLTLLVIGIVGFVASAFFLL